LQGFVVLVVISYRFIKLVFAVEKGVVLSLREGKGIRPAKFEEKGFVLEAIL
jgi:hypothetical protein